MKKVIIFKLLACGLIFSAQLSAQSVPVSAGQAARQQAAFTRFVTAQSNACVKGEDLRKETEINLNDLNKLCKSIVGLHGTWTLTQNIAEKDAVIAAIHSLRKAALNLKRIKRTANIEGEYIQPLLNAENDVLNAALDFILSHIEL